jgi:outer membrane protein insertion porin family
LNFYVYDLENYGYSFGFSTGVSNKITFNTTISRNSVDSPMFPRSGSSITLGIELTPPYSNFNNIDYENADNATKYKWMEYHKWMFDASYYLQLAGNLVLSSRTHFGFLGSYGVDIGPFERFSLGGDGLAGQNYLLGKEIIALRGYGNNSIEPIDRQGIQGGIAYNKFVFELRYPVSLNPSATIYVLGFAEAGNNFSNFNEYDPFILYRSAGFGARVFMPAFGLLGIDWGYGFDPIPGKDEHGSQFHFSIGQQIR